MYAPQITNSIWKVTLGIFTLAVVAVPTVSAQQFQEPVVAREQMTLATEDKVLDVIEKGDLLTIVAEDKETYTIVTFNGVRGIVDKVNALKLAESVEVYNEVIAETPNDGRFYTLRASAWWARGEQKKALDDFDKAIKLGYTKPEAYSSRGIFYQALNQHDKAIEDYTKAIEGDPKDPSHFINRAAAYMAIKKYADAIKDYTTAVELSPKSSTTYQQRGVAYKVNGQIKEAVYDFTKTIELNPKSASGYMSRGYALFQLGRAKLAIKDFGKVIELEPSSAAAYNNRGFNLQILGEYELALVDYEKSIELAPEYALAYQNKGWLLATASKASVRDGKAAIKAAAKACELREFKVLTDVKTLAAAFAEAEDFKRAIGWQEKAIALASKEQKAGEEEVLEQYQQGQPFRVLVAPQDDAESK